MQLHCKMFGVLQGTVNKYQGALDFLRTETTKKDDRYLHVGPKGNHVHRKLVFVAK